MARSFLLAAFLVAISLSISIAEDIGTPIVDRQPIISSLGFSFVPPPGEDWYEKFGEDQITYTKKMNPVSGTLFAEAIEYHTKMEFSAPEQFREWLSSKRNPLDIPPRYKKRSATYELEPTRSPYCVKYIEEFEDREPKYFFGSPFLVVVNYGITCMHPRRHDSLVDIYYSYRYPPNDKKPKLVSEGEGFVNSLRVLEVGK
jgi:hypothetical protein